MLIPLLPNSTGTSTHPAKRQLLREELPSNREKRQKGKRKLNAVTLTLGHHLPGFGSGWKVVLPKPSECAAPPVLVSRSAKNLLIKTQGQTPFRLLKLEHPNPCTGSVHLFRNEATYLASKCGA